MHETEVHEHKISDQTTWCWWECSCGQRSGMLTESKDKTAWRAGHHVGYTTAEKILTIKR